MQCFLKKLPVTNFIVITCSKNKGLVFIVLSAYSSLIVIPCKAPNLHVSLSDGVKCVTIRHQVIRQWIHSINRSAKWCRKLEAFGTFQDLSYPLLSIRTVQPAMAKSMSVGESLKTIEQSVSKDLLNLGTSY